MQIRLALSLPRTSLHRVGRMDRLLEIFVRDGWIEGIIQHNLVDSQKMGLGRSFDGVFEGWCGYTSTAPGISWNQHSPHIPIHDHLSTPRVRLVCMAEGGCRRGAGSKDGLRCGYIVGT